MDYLYEKDTDGFSKWNTGSNIIYPLYEYTPGNIIIVGVECKFHVIDEIEVALLDTAAQFSVVGQEIYEALYDSIQPSSGSITMSSRFGRINGFLERVEIGLIADKGEDFNLEATFVFSKDWLGPTVLGFSNCLDKIRVAIDPLDKQTGRIFFGSA